MALDFSILQSNQTFIPFLFVLAVVFGILEITNIFRNRGANFLIALAISFFSITNAAFVAFLWSQFGNITAFFIIMFLIAFVLEVFGLRRPKPGQSRALEGMVISGAILFLLLGLGFINANLFPELPIIGGGSNLIILFAILFIIALFWMALKAGEQQPTAVPAKRE